MDSLALLVLVMIGLLGFDVAALGFGVDSRDGPTDDHRRPIIP